MITTIVCTKDRPDKIKECCESILHNNFKHFELFVTDQNNDNKTKNIIKKIALPLIKYFKIKKKGLSKARNFGIKKAKGEIIAFTDDDCIVSKDWLKNIHQSFQKNKEIVGIFGQTKSYQPQKNKGFICPCTFTSNKKRIIDKPTLHWQHIGFGNNMAFKKEIFAKNGLFKEWLGAGSITKSAEDAEFTLRLLSKGYKILYDPKVVVYHNRWLTNEEYYRQSLSYSCGEMASYGYLAFQGLTLGKKVVFDNFKDSYWEFRKAVKSLLLFKKGSVKLLFENFEKLFFRLRGLLIGWYYSRKD